MLGSPEKQKDQSTLTIFRSKNFDALNEHEGNKKAVFLAKKFCEKYPNVDRGLMFMGPAGTGKTHLAQAIANHIGSGVYWASMSELLAELRPGSGTQKAIEVAEKCFHECNGFCSIVQYRSKPSGNCLFCQVVLKGKQPILGHAATAPLLILDDVGTDKPTDWVATQVYMLLQQRTENGLPVIATTNYSLDQLKERLGHDRSPSRLSGLCYPQEVTGDDWRLKCG